MKKVLYRVLVLFLIVVFVYSAYQVGSYYYGTYRNKRETAELIENINHGEEAKEKPFALKYAEIIKKNEDFIGWIEIQDTSLNYPVMYTPNDPEYYLRRNFDKEYEFRGTIFVGGNTDLERPSDNIILYGHNMDDHTMFGALRPYKDESYYKEHPLIHFETKEGSYDYEIFSVFRTVDSPSHELYIDYYRFIDATSAEQFNSYISEFISRSYYDTGIVPSYGDKLLTLSTCEYTEKNGRLVVVARRIE